MLITDECRTRFYIKLTSCENLANFSEIRMQDFPLPLYVTLVNKLASLGASVCLAVESGHVHPSQDGKITCMEDVRQGCFALSFSLSGFSDFAQWSP